MSAKVVQSTRAAGLEVLAAFLPRAGGRYTRERNEDRGAGAHDAVSNLSPFLRHRLLTEAEVIYAAYDRHGMAAEKFIQEVFWRTYFKGWLEHRPETWERYLAERTRDLEALSADEMGRQHFEAACAGETAYEPFNHWVRELKATGYLHNHARMWFASIWIFTLKLPWTLGADLFMRYLLDGDPASNTLSWRWVAGLHTKGKHYLARADNIERYTGGRFGPVFGLNEQAEPLVERNIEVDPLETPARCQTFIDSSDPAAAPRTGDGLLLHEDDLSCIAIDGAEQLEARAILPFVDGRATSNVDAAVAGHVEQALADAANRHQADRLSRATADSLQQWVAANSLKRVLTPYAPIGPAATVIASLQAALAEQSVELISIRSHYDAQCWPYCKKGFFALKKQIPRLIDQVGKAATTSSAIASDAVSPGDSIP